MYHGQYSMIVCNSLLLRVDVIFPAPVRDYRFGIKYLTNLFASTYYFSGKCYRIGFAKTNTIKHCADSKSVSHIQKFIRWYFSTDNCSIFHQPHVIQLTLRSVVAECMYRCTQSYRRSILHNQCILTRQYDAKLFVFVLFWTVRSLSTGKSSCDPIDFVCLIICVPEYLLSIRWPSYPLANDRLVILASPLLLEIRI